MKHISAFAQSHPDKVAYRMAESGETLTFAQLDDLSNRGAQAFRALGVGLGGSVALLFENRLDFLGLAWAAQRSGVFYTAISTHLTVDEIAYIMTDCGAQIAVLSDTFAHLMKELQGKCPDIRFFISGACDDPDLHWQKVQDSMPTTQVKDEAAGADVLYSSGTTGRPKGIVRSFERQPVDTVIPGLMKVLCEDMADMDAASVYLSPAPLYHAAPLRFTMMTVMIGGTAIVMEKFDAATMLELIAHHGVTHTQVVPTMFVRLLRLPQEMREQADISTLQVAFHAAAPCPKDIKGQMIEWWGPILIEYYAGSEANGVTVATSEDWLTYPGTVGKSLLGEIAVLDEDGHKLPIGATGAIYFDSGIEFAYRNAPEKTAGAYAWPGCSTLGDVGYVNEEGYLFLTDRASYTIISGGVNIYPQETEDVLASHPQVADVAVFGAPNPEMGEEVKAVVQLEPGIVGNDAKAAELIDWCKSRLSHVKAPRSVDFRETLPRTPTGKMVKRRLKDEYWANHSSADG